MSTSSGEVSGKSVRVTLSLTGTGNTNEYIATVTMSTSSSYVYNLDDCNWRTDLPEAYRHAQRCYIVIGGVSHIIGSSRISNGSFVHGSTFSKRFTVSSNTEVYARVACGWCEDGRYNVYHNGDAAFMNRTSSSSAIYTDPNKNPGTPSIICHNSAINGNYIAEDQIHLELTQVSDPDGDTVRYCIRAGAKRPGGGWEQAGDQNGFILWSTTDRHAYYNISGFPRGTQFSFYGYTEDGRGGRSADTHKMENIFRNKMPYDIGWISPSDGYFNDSINLTWDRPGDPDGQNVLYTIGLSKNNGPIQALVEKQSIANYRYDISNDPEGTVYQFSVTANDGMVSSRTKMTNNIGKNRKPSAPTYIFPNSGYELGNVRITWNAATDPEGRGIREYRVYINGNRINSNSTISGTSTTWTMPQGDVPGTEYRISVEAIDNDGLIGSRGHASGAFKKAETPKEVTFINPNSSEIYFDNSILIEWTGVAANGSNAKYTLEYKINNGTWINLISETGYLRFVHNLDNINRGDSIRYRIKSLNNFGSSAFVESIECFKKNPPSKPVIMYPKVPASIFGKNRTRICVSIPADKDNIMQVVYVEYNNRTFNSMDNKDMFSSKDDGWTQQKNIVIDLKNLLEGENTIYVYSRSAGVIGEKSSLKISCSELSNINDGELITASLINDIYSKVNILRSEYGLSAYAFSTNTTIKNASVKFEYIRQIRLALDQLRNTINDFDNTSVSKITSDWKDPGQGDVIYVEYINQLIEAIKHI